VGASPFVIMVDHAGHRIPKRLGDLGLPASELLRHIAWDIALWKWRSGCRRARRAAVGANLFSPDHRLQPRSKVPTSIPRTSESIDIPGNMRLAEAEVAARRAEIFEPYHERVRAVLDGRVAEKRSTILVAQHTMTDAYKGARREMHAAVLYNRDRRFAGLVLDALRASRAWL